MASAKQKRAQADMAAFVAAMGRRPRKGESIKGYSARGAAPRPKSSAPSDAAAAKRRRAAKKAAATRSTWHYKAKKAVSDHPVASTLVGLGGAAVAVPRSRAAIANGARRLVAVVRTISR